jgi:UDP-glucose:(heptosyl)LPS alpha-1,3-glucosyltransferase
VTEPSRGSPLPQGRVPDARDGLAHERPLAVAIVRARYNPHGGAERYTQRALAALDAIGLDLTLIARRWPAGAGEGLPARWRLLATDPFHIGSLWRDWSFASAVRRLLRGSRFDLVQSHERIAGVSLYRAGDGVHASYLQARDRVLPAWRRLLVRLSPRHRWVLREERAMFTDPRLRAVICNSRAVLDDIADRFAVPRERLHLLRNGIDLERFRPPQPGERAQARAAFGLASGATLLAFVGSGFERKGLATAIAALAMAPAGVELAVAGTDRHARRFRALAHRLGVAGRVRFLGGVDDVRPLLWASDGFLAPALYDPYPNAALEALACGLPLIASTGCGVSELVEPGRNGFVHDALDVAGIAGAIGRVAASGDDDAMRRAARASALPWSIEAAGQALVALYRRLLAESPAP